MPNEDITQDFPVNQKDKKKKFLIFGVFLITLFVFVISGAFLYFTLVGNSSPETNPTETEESAEPIRVLGESAGKLPYAPVDEKNTVSQSFDKSGGVLTTTLSKV